MLNPVPEVKGMVVTINVTTDCNLRCKYCYETGKAHGVIKKDYYEKFIDQLLLGQIPVHATETIQSVVDSGFRLDLLGGDALMYPEVCDDILQYFTRRLIELDHPRKTDIQVNVCSNGTLFGSEPVRRFLTKWRGILQVEVSIDGTPALHDLNRVYKDGRGSMDTILRDWPWFKATFPTGSQYTKSTLSKGSIPYMYDSLVYMHETMGLKYIYQNFIMEDMGLEDADLRMIDEQMSMCLEYVLIHRDELYWSMMDRRYERTSNPGASMPNQGWCGSGAMPTLGLDGKIYLCPHWLPLCMSSCVDMSIGSVDEGITRPWLSQYIQDNSMRPVVSAGLECESCGHESACPYCIAGAYDEFKEFKRTTHICEVTKMQHKWAKEYWRRYDEINKDQ